METATDNPKQKPYFVKRDCSVWCFDTAGDVALFLWGKYLPYYRVFKNDKRVVLRGPALGEDGGAGIGRIEEKLEAA